MEKGFKIASYIVLVLLIIFLMGKIRNLGAQSSIESETDIDEEILLTEEEEDQRQYLEDPRIIGDSFFDAFINMDFETLNQLTDDKYNFDQLSNISDEERILLDNVLSRSSYTYLSQDLTDNYASLNYQFESLDLQGLVDQAVSANMMNILKNGRDTDLDFSSINYDSIEKTSYPVTFHLERQGGSWLISHIESEGLDKILDFLN